mmetsp:Transcript_36244/g.85992  ORF Transcript_36244/g.85992 Transcript_36244/m.85992 type:complete len:224 (-) Transcript_36244:927-1598(-)
MHPPVGRLYHRRVGVLGPHVRPRCLVDLLELTGKAPGEAVVPGDGNAEARSAPGGRVVVWVVGDEEAPVGEAHGIEARVGVWEVGPDPAGPTRARPVGGAEDGVVVNVSLVGPPAVAAADHPRAAVPPEEQRWLQDGPLERDGVAALPRLPVVSRGLHVHLPCGLIARAREDGAVREHQRLVLGGAHDALGELLRGAPCPASVAGAHNAPLPLLRRVADLIEQ